MLFLFKISPSALPINMLHGSAEFVYDVKMRRFI